MRKIFSAGSSLLFFVLGTAASAQSDSEEEPRPYLEYSNLNQPSPEEAPQKEGDAKAPPSGNPGTPPAAGPAKARCPSTEVIDLANLAPAERKIVCNKRGFFWDEPVCCLSRPAP